MLDERKNIFRKSYAGLDLQKVQLWPRGQNTFLPGGKGNSIEREILGLLCVDDNM